MTRKAVRPKRHRGRSRGNFSGNFSDLPSMKDSYSDSDDDPHDQKQINGLGSGRPEVAERESISIDVEIKGRGEIAGASSGQSENPWEDPEEDRHDENHCPELYGSADSRQNDMPEPLPPVG